MNFLLILCLTIIMIFFTIYNILKNNKHYILFAILSLVFIGFLFSININHLNFIPIMITLILIMTLLTIYYLIMKNKLCYFFGIISLFLILFFLIFPFIN